MASIHLNLSAQGPLSLLEMHMGLLCIHQCINGPSLSVGAATITGPIHTNAAKLNYPASLNTGHDTPSQESPQPVPLKKWNYLLNLGRSMLQRATFPLEKNFHHHNSFSHPCQTTLPNTLSHNPHLHTPTSTSEQSSQRVFGGMARIQNALASVTERFQGFEQFRAVWF